MRDSSVDKLLSVSDTGQSRCQRGVGCHVAAPEEAVVTNTWPLRSYTALQGVGSAHCLRAVYIIQYVPQWVGGGRDEADEGQVIPGRASSVVPANATELVVV